MCLRTTLECVLARDLITLPCNTSHQGLETTHFGKGCLIFHQILQLLLKVYPELLHICTTTPQLDQERNPIFLGKRTG